MTRVLVIPDLHCPFQHPGAIKFLSQIAREFKPTKVVCTGDEIDSYGVSRFGRDPDAMGQGEELRRAVAALKPLYRLFPVVQVCESNHTWRPFKRAAEGQLPRAFLRSIGDVLEAPRGWTWAPWHKIGGVLYCHGEGFSGAAGALKAARDYRCNTVIGHLHAYAGVQYCAGRDSTVWGMNVGCLIDDNAVAFSYAKYFANRATLGCGIVEGGVPTFVPYR